MKWVAAIVLGMGLGLLYSSGPTDQEAADATFKAHVDARKAARAEKQRQRVERIYKENQR